MEKCNLLLIGWTLNGYGFPSRESFSNAVANNFSQEKSERILIRKQDDSGWYSAKTLRYGEA